MTRPRAEGAPAPTPGDPAGTDGSAPPAVPSIVRRRSLPSAGGLTVDGPRPRRSGRGRAASALVLLSIAVAAAAVLSAATGAVGVPPLSVIGALADHLGLGTLGVDVSARHDAVIWNIRLPRVLLGLLVGACLGCAGAILQGLSGNPLADPALVGVSGGAAAGAAAAIVAAPALLGQWTVPTAAFLGGLLATSVVYLAARRDGRTEIITLMLAGVAVGAVANALVGLAIFTANDQELRDITFWSLGSIGGATWTALAAVAPPGLVGLVLALRLARPLDLLALGEREAAHLGLPVERTHRQAVALVALLTAAAVAFTGIIWFIGLVAPHLVRLVGGPRHAMLLPASALVGAGTVVLADLAARTIAVPAEVPLGVVTALVGGPVFVLLLRRTRNAHGGWA
ncbi:iron ABC transporter permease [Frankia sp. Cpl3]|nr:iron ABC transporter permease [Parafrankia colletiae]MCK9899567.1 iron ABC transporter permease [Frankia sp. Cpl3]